MNLEQAVQSISQQLSGYTSTPRLEAELLIVFACQLKRTFLYTEPQYILNPTQEHDLRQVVERRLAGEPMAYILGYQEFWSLQFIVTTDTLIPRPETEHLVEWILAHFSKEQVIRLADLGTGCGAIAIVLASERPHWHIDAVDQSAAALKIAKLNANQLQQSVSFYLGNWCHALPHFQYDILVSNPPYLPPDDAHLPDLRFEPLSALTAEQQGLAAFETISTQALQYLKPGGFLVLEHGCMQAESLKQMLEHKGFINIERHLDLADLPRFITAQLESSVSNKKNFQSI